MPQSWVCPRCDKPVEPAWWTCPHCEAVLKGAETGSRGGVLHGLLERLADLPNVPWTVIPALLGFLVVIFVPLGLVPIAALWFAWLDFAKLVSVVAIPAVILIAAYFCTRQRPYIARHVGGIFYGGLVF